MYFVLLPGWQHTTGLWGVCGSKLFFLTTKHQETNKVDHKLYLTKNLYWFTWDCIFILERLLAWCHESSLLPSLPWDTTHRCKGSWQLPGCPAHSPSFPTTWSCCPFQNHACSSMSYPLTARHYPTSWKGAVSAPAPHRGGYREVGDFEDMLFCPTTILETWGSSLQKKSVTGCWVAGGARLACCRSATINHCSLVNTGKSHHAPRRSSPSAWGAACFIETQTFNWDSLGERMVHEWPCKRTRVLHCPETMLDDLIALVAWGRQDASNEVCVALRSSQKVFPPQV